MKSPSRNFAFFALRGIAAALALSVVCPSTSTATPYASGLTNTGTSISFRLNEAADVVKVISSGGATTNNLGALGVGVHTANLVIAGPFQVEVGKTSGLGYLQGIALQISSDANTFMQFFSARGVAVNNNPASPYFGRIYVANAVAGTTAVGARSTGDGFYVVNPDFTDALGQGNTALTGGLTHFSTGAGAANTPWHIEIGEDGNLYIADFNTNTGSIYMTDPNVSAGSGTNLLSGFGAPLTATAGPNHGRFGSSIIATGSLADSTLTLFGLEGDLAPINGLRRFDIGGSGSLPYSADSVNLADPILLAIINVTVDMDRGPDGKFYLLQNRSAGAQVGVAVVDPAVDVDMSGLYDVVYDSYGDTQFLLGFPDPAAADFLAQSRAVKISPDGRFMAVIRDDSDTWIVPLVNGIPDLANRKLINTGNITIGRDVCFDAAGNLYTVSSGDERLRVFSPGLKSIATTGSGGTFGVIHLFPESTSVSLTSLDTNLYERIPEDKGLMLVSRVGDPSASLTVNYTISGTAANGTDYQMLASSIEIPAGAFSVTNEVVPMDNSLLTGDKTVVITLAPSGSYTVDANNNVARLLIRDDENLPSALLFSDDFETDTSANWTVRFSAANAVPDFTVDFAYDYGLLDGIPSAPHSSGGSTRGVRVKVNKDATASAASANLYPVGQSFSNDYALRFDMFISVGTDVGGQTEHTIAGINHSGNLTNRHATAGSDGLWFAIDGDGSNNRGFASYVSTNSSAAPGVVAKSNDEFNSFFTVPPYGFDGSPNNITNSAINTISGRIWADGEISQIGNVFRLKVNNTLIWERTNTFNFKSGNIMIGHEDQFASTGSTNTYTIFDNVRVVSLTVKITSIRIVAGKLEIEFKDDSMSGGPYMLRKAGVVTDSYQPDNNAMLTSLGGGMYRFTAELGDSPQFYQVSR